MKRHREWKQQNPRDQIVAILNAARGIAGNIMEKRYPTVVGPNVGRGHPKITVQNAAAQIDDMLAQIYELSKMVKGEWPEEKHSPR